VYNITKNMQILIKTIIIGYYQLIKDIIIRDMKLKSIDLLHITGGQKYI